MNTALALRSTLIAEPHVLPQELDAAGRVPAPVTAFEQRVAKKRQGGMK